MKRNALVCLYQCCFLYVLSARKKDFLYVLSAQKKDFTAISHILFLIVLNRP